MALADNGHAIHVQVVKESADDDCPATISIQKNEFG
jgi:hypothetical protein